MARAGGRAAVGGAGDDSAGESFFVAAPSRVRGGPAIVAVITGEEEARAVLCSGADELGGMARGGGSGWGGPGGRSSGSGIALRKFAVDDSAPGITALLPPRGSSAPLRRGGAPGGGAPAGGAPGGGAPGGGAPGGGAAPGGSPPYKPGGKKGGENLCL